MTGCNRWLTCRVHNIWRRRRWAKIRRRHDEAMLVAFHQHVADGVRERERLKRRSTVDEIVKAIWT